MDVDPVTSSDAVAELAYDALIGSEFEQRHGWHVNLMPDMVLKQFPEGWAARAKSSVHGHLTVTVPTVEDLLAPKRQRNEPRDQQHEAYAQALGLI